MPLVPPPAQKLKWSEIRDALKKVVIEAAPGAKVHSRWALKYSLEQTLTFLTEDTNPDKIHAWMISVYGVTTEETKAGGGVSASELEYTLEVRIWGFMGHDYGNDTINSESTFEDEIDNVISWVKANRVTGLGLNEPVRRYLGGITLPIFQPIEVAAFGEGADVHVCQGTMTIKVKR